MLVVAVGTGVDVSVGTDVDVGTGVFVGADVFVEGTGVFVDSTPTTIEIGNVAPNIFPAPSCMRQ